MTNHTSTISTSPPVILSAFNASEYLTSSNHKILCEIASGMLRLARFGRRIVVRLKDLDEKVEERLH